MFKSISLTEGALPFVHKLLKNFHKLYVEVLTINEATVIDCGINVKGSLEAALLFTKISLGGLAKVNLRLPHEGENSDFLYIQVATSHPVLATLGCQAASWNVNKGDFIGMLCGPGRALAQKPSKTYKLLEYNEKHEKAVLCIESDRLPTEEVIEYLAEKCSVEKRNLTLLVIKTSCLVQYIQMAARAIELGIFRLVEQLNYPKERILHAVGLGLVAPFSQEIELSNDRVNNALIYGTKLYLLVKSEPNDNLPELVTKMPSKTSSSYGKRFLTAFKDAGENFANFDLTLLAPTEIIVNDIRTSKIFREGKINTKLLEN